MIKNTSIMVKNTSIMFKYTSIRGNEKCNHCINQFLKGLILLLNRAQCRSLKIRFEVEKVSERWEKLTYQNFQENIEVLCGVIITQHIWEIHAPESACDSAAGAHCMVITTTNDLKGITG